MKIRRLLVIISMLAVMFSLSACSETEKEKPFMYDDTEVVLSSMQLFDQYVQIPESNYEYLLDSEVEVEAEAIKGIKQAKETDKVGKFEDYSDYYSGNQRPDIGSDVYTIVNEDDYIMVTIKNKAENRDVDIQIKYVENTEYTMQYNQGMAVKQDIIDSYVTMNGGSFDDFLAAYNYDSFEDYVDTTLAEAGIRPYLASEIVVSPVYSKKELVGQAGMNTLIGMGTVFVVLIFISFIISLFKFLPAIFSSKKTVEPAPVAKPVAAPVVSAVEEEEDLVNDEELVAVIMAAIQAATADQGVCTDSNDTLVVRSIRRAKVRR